MNETEPPSTIESVSETIDKTNVTNILKRLQAGKFVTAEEKEAVLAWEQKQRMEARIEATRGLSFKQQEFCRAVATGLSNVEAYRRVYKPKHPDNRHVIVHASRVANRPAVKAQIQVLQARSDAKTILTMNDRLAILAHIAQHGLHSDRVKAIAEYNKMSGDHAPDKHEHSGPGGGPIPVADQTAVPARRLSIRDKIAVFKQRREAEAAQNLAAGRN